MKAWVVTEKCGNLEKLEIQEGVALPEPKGNEIRIKNIAVGLNPVDYKRCTWGFMPYPQVLGLDGCGTIDKFGPEVQQTEKLQEGNLVFYHGDFNTKYYGAFAEYYILPADVVVPLSKQELGFALSKASISVSELAQRIAALPCAAWTAYYALFKKLKLDQSQKKVRTLVITAGAGGVGGFCIQLAKALIPYEFQLITTCSPKNEAFVKKLGADVVIDYNKEDVAARVKEITKGIGADAWVDNVSAESVATALSCLAFGGDVVAVVGSPQTPMSELSFSSQSIHNVALGAAHGSRDPAAKAEFIQMGTHVLQLMLEGKVDPMIASVLPFEQIKQGLQTLQGRHQTGKLVATVSTP